MSHWKTWGGAGLTIAVMMLSSCGKTGFVATNSTAEGRAENRRVELVPNE